jgi:hypothetical protein
MISLVIICPWLLCCLSPNPPRCVDRRLHHPNVHSLDIRLDSITTAILKFCVSTANVDLRSLFLQIRIEVASHFASCFWNRKPEFFISSRNLSTADPWRVACQWFKIDIMDEWCPCERFLRSSEMNSVSPWSWIKTIPGKVHVCSPESEEAIMLRLANSAGYKTSRLSQLPDQYSCTSQYCPK